MISKYIFNGKRLIDLRIAKGLTKAELELEADLSTSHVAALENGKIKDPTMTIVYRLSKYFGVPMEEFLIEKQTETIKS